MRCLYHPQVKSDVIQAATYYDLKQPGLSESFKWAFKQGVKHMAEAPLRWRKFCGPYRRCNLKRFPYYIVYRYDGKKTIFVFALVHTRRHPNSWHSRKEKGE